MNNIEPIFQAYTAITAAMLAAKHQHFPHRSVVQVTHARYNGPGIVVHGEEPPDQLAVMLCNDNTWYYPINACQPLPRKDWPAWVVKSQRKFKAIQRKNQVLERLQAQGVH